MKTNAVLELRRKSQAFALSLLAASVVLKCFNARPAFGASTLTNLATFNETVGDQPLGILLQGVDGNFYGNTKTGGPGGWGTVFRMTPNGTLTNLISFDTSNGGAPSGLVQGSDGCLYGTTSGGGGVTQIGTVFQANTNGALTRLAAFQGTNGSVPVGLMQGADGSLYGTTYFGGIGFVTNNPRSGFGTIYKITTNGIFTNLVFFNGTNGSNPDKTLIQCADGNFYGTTDSGGADTNLNNVRGEYYVGHGTVFKMTPDGALATLASFDSTNGGGIVSGLLQGIDGNLYGFTQIGGINKSGTIFQITTNGTLSTILALNGTNFAYPLCLAQSADGTFYCGTHGGPPPVAANIFKMTKTGMVSPLFSFGESAVPVALMQATDGNFYGATTQGGNDLTENLFRMSVPVAPVFKTTTQSSGKLAFTWTAVTGQTYQLQYCTDLTQSNWTNLGGAFIATNGMISTSDNIAPDPQRVYRAVLIP